MPPPADRDDSLAQLTLEPEPDEPDDELDEHPVASSTAAVIPANANRYGDLTSAS
jgi:hypothetical protein